MSGIDATIGQLERLYQTLTGTQPPAVGEHPYAPIPPEVDPERHVNEELERLTGLLGGAATPARRSLHVTPQVSVWQAPDAFVIYVDMPGVEREAVQVAVDGRTLLVRAERKTPTADDLEPRWVEHSSCVIERRLSLPATGGEPLRATLRNGVLEVRVPRKPLEEVTQTITVD